MPKSVPTKCIRRPRFPGCRRVRLLLFFEIVHVSSGLFRSFPEGSQDFPGFSPIFRDFPESPGFLRDFRVFPGGFRTFLEFSGRLPGFSGIFWDHPGFSGISGISGISPGFPGYSGRFPDFSGVFRIRIGSNSTPIRSQKLKIGQNCTEKVPLYVRMGPRT